MHFSIKNNFKNNHNHTHNQTLKLIKGNYSTSNKNTNSLATSWVAMQR